MTNESSQTVQTRKAATVLAFIADIAKQIADPTIDVSTATLHGAQLVACDFFGAESADEAHAINERCGLIAPLPVMSLEDAAVGQCQTAINEWAEIDADEAGEDVALTPEPGMGATLPSGSDCRAATIVCVSNNGKTIEVAEDDWKIINGGSEANGSAEYEFTTNPANDVQTYTLRKNGKYILKGQPMNAYWHGVCIGHRSRRMDPSF